MKAIKYLAPLLFVMLSCNKGNDPVKLLPAPPVAESLKEYFVPIEGEDTRPLMGATAYGVELNKLLNDSLDRTIGGVRIKREKVVAAAKFIASLKEAVPYSYETTPNGIYKYVARYNRRGLFLSSFTENGINYIPWGQQVKTPDKYRDRYSNLGETCANGLHCSSFVCWVLYNSGYTSDLALLDKTYADTFPTFPGATILTLKGNVDKIKAGDLLYFPGHIALVAQTERDDIMIIESAIWGSNHTDPRNGVRWRTFSKTKTNYDTFRFKSIVKLDYGD